MIAGYHRVKLREVSTGQDWFEFFLALDQSGRVDSGDPGPFLFKARWFDEYWSGELEVDEASAQNEIVWLCGKETPADKTDLGTAPIAAGAVMSIFTSDGKRRSYRVEKLEKL